MPKARDAVPIGPWQNWLAVQVGMHGSRGTADMLGCDEAQVRRWTAWHPPLAWNGEVTTISLARVTELLDNTGTPVGALYPDAVDIELEEDGYCGRCHEVVTPIAGECPWCDSPVEDATGHDKRYCEPCDRLVTPANNGTCWRCGAMTQATVPWSPCACGCGELKRTFDAHGRRVHYLVGHAPRSLEKAQYVPLEPFARYLEDQLANLDVIGALASMHSIPREQVVAILARDGETVEREVVRRALWTAARGGLGKGLKPHPDRLGFFDLYPDDARAKTCPGCGGGKSRQADLCKTCRKRTGRPPGRPCNAPRLREEVIAAAYRTYVDENLTQIAVAERFLPHVPNRSANSLVHSLRREWERRGWPTDRQRRRIGVSSGS